MTVVRMAFRPQDGSVFAADPGVGLGLASSQALNVYSVSARGSAAVLEFGSVRSRK